MIYESKTFIEHICDLITQLDEPFKHTLCFSAGLLESSMRLKPHEAQDYRKKALWVSWISIVVTLILAVAAFSKY